jgi:hypothetical protein
MTNRPNGNTSVSSTDVLIAMLTHDLRGSWAERRSSRSHEHIDPAGSGPLPAIQGDAELVEPAEPAAPAVAAR